MGVETDKIFVSLRFSMYILWVAWSAENKSIDGNKIEEKSIVEIKSITLKISENKIEESPLFLATVAIEHVTIFSHQGDI